MTWSLKEKLRVYSQSMRWCSIQPHYCNVCLKDIWGHCSRSGHMSQHTFSLGTLHRQTMVMRCRKMKMPSHYHAKTGNYAVSDKLYAVPLQRWSYIYLNCWTLAYDFFVNVDISRIIIWTWTIKNVDDFGKLVCE